MMKLNQNDVAAVVMVATVAVFMSAFIVRMSGIIETLP
jgi:hypothetical protein